MNVYLIILRAYRPLTNSWSTCVSIILKCQEDQLRQIVNSGFLPESTSPETGDMQ